MIRRGFIVALACSVPGATAAQNVAEVQVAPPTVTLRVGERSGLLATAFDRIGNVIPTVRIIWSSNNINVAKVDNNGTVTGVANGVAIVEARACARRSATATRARSVGGATGWEWTGRGAAARARGRLFAPVRELACFPAGVAGGRLSSGARQCRLDIATPGRGERRSKRERRGALARSGHDTGDRLGRWR